LNVVEIHALWEVELRKSRCLQEAQENCDIKAHVLREADNHVTEEPQPPNPMTTDIVDHRSTAATANTVLVGSMDSPIDEDISLGDALFNRASEATPTTWEDDGFLTMIKKEYSKDKFFALILERPTDYKGFTVDDQLIWYTNPKGDKVVCIPRDHKLIVRILDQAHFTLGHFGGQRTDKYV
jgi:hypothetical protein